MKYRLNRLKIMINLFQQCPVILRSITLFSLLLGSLITTSCFNGVPMPSRLHSETERRVYKTVADTYVKQDKPTQAFGRLLHLEIFNNDNVITFLRFDVNEQDFENITTATIRLSVMNGASQGNIKVFVIDDDWDERKLTWRNRPEFGTQITELPFASIDKDEWLELPLGQAITGNGTYSFALTTSSRDRVGFRSLSTKRSPELVLQFQDAARKPVQTTPPLLIGDRISFKPEPLSVSAPEIVNPMRGLYRWMGQEYALQPAPSLDAYNRYTWRDLEPTQGDYSFAKLEADIAKAAREGRKYSFRVRTVVATKGSAIPDYAMTGAGWWADYNKDNARDTYIPDWNDPAFLERLDTFMEALGKRYNNDPRVAFLDIGLFGNWGEWHMSGFSYPSSSGAQRATTTTRYRLVDMHIDAFPSTPLVMMTDDAEALVYAMKRSPRIGWRRDSLGWNTGHFGKVERDPVRWNAVKDRWKTALVVSEFCNPRYQDDPEVFEQALSEVERYHVSLVSNANTIKWSELSAAGKEAFVRVGKTAGYRLVLDELVLPGTILAGSTFDITTRWENTGVAPVYEPWQVAVQLRKAGSDEVAWETTSGIELTSVLPGGPLEQSDRVTVPGNVAQGEYDVVVIVQDPRQTRAPLALALADVQPDGSYRLGSVSVR